MENSILPLPRSTAPALHFRGFENAKRFMDRLNRISRASKVRIALGYGGMRCGLPTGFQHEPFLTIRKMDVGVKGAYRITVLLCTHQCRNAPGHLHENATRIGPGISVYDVRSAIVVEKSFQRFLRTKRAYDMSPKHQVIPNSVEKIREMQREEDILLMNKPQRLRSLHGRMRFRSLCLSHLCGGMTGHAPIMTSKT
jgi:hypothetical protein